jgi:hypothetical protein
MYTYGFAKRLDGSEAGTAEMTRLLSWSLLWLPMTPWLLLYHVEQAGANPVKTQLGIEERKSLRCRRTYLMRKEWILLVLDLKVNCS